ncbi:GxxExxY protein [Ectothiorhodospiraceae bacterium WFHF3C12]|nr:GxxExxY protein [Ectothiorhodospiraceae bacterium WFHF3C12]
MNTDVHDRGASKALTQQVIGAAFEVSNYLGSGLLEKVYENALVVELSQRGVPLEVQRALPVFYKGSLVGDYIADMVVAERVLVELKCVQGLREEHTAQCINYLRASGLRLCLLLNFQRPRLEWKRIAL